jgi:hypothetical protein
MCLPVEVVLFAIAKIAKLHTDTSKEKYCRPFVIASCEINFARQTLKAAWQSMLTHG